MVEQVKTKSEPRVRFRGFDDEWEEVKLGELLSYEQPTKYIVDSDNYDDSFITPVLTAGKSFLLGYTDETDGVYDKGDVILFDDFTTATQLVNFEFKVKSSAMKLLTPIAENNINFLYETLNLIRYPHDDHKRYWISEYATLKVKTPSSLDEQQKIGELFQTLDKTIDLSNTQVENLKQQKKTLLQRLFPQKGETEPKVRLRGFTDEWDSSLLLDEIEVYQPKSLPQSKFLDEGYPVYGANGMIGYYDEYNHENRQIAMACRGNTAGVVNIIPEQSYITGNAMIMDVYTNNKLDFNFMGQLFNNFDFTPYISGSGQPQITRSALTGVYIQLPSLEEQQAIGELFQTLDEQIRLAEDNVSQYKELKQALLQRLFV